MVSDWMLVGILFVLLYLVIDLYQTNRKLNAIWAALITPTIEKDKKP
tara:strand:- start:1 stop:141 length:141 start_codon:yes stop_codon:yes gene_type:complete